MMGRNAIRLTLIVFVLAAAATQLVALHMSRLWSQRDPGYALSWHADPDALINQADVVGAEPARRDEAEQLARNALRARPLDGRGYRVLADLADARKQTARAEALFRQAVRFAPRDLRTRLWLLQQDLKQGRIESALTNMDTALRISPDLQSSLFPVLSAIAAFPEHRAKLARILASPPPWRGAFWRQLCQVPGNSANATALYQALKPSSHPLGDDEVQYWIESLIRDQRWSDAYAVWVDTLPDEQVALTGNLFDGGFSTEPTETGFGWRVEAVSGAHVEFMETTGLEGARGMTVSFNGQRVPFQHVSQLLTLTPGRYVLKGRLRLDRLRNERGLQWVVDCADAGGPTGIGASDLYSGASDWQDFRMPITVPTQKCGAQWLRLQLAARIPAEQFASGMAWFGDLAIERMSTEKSP